MSEDGGIYSRLTLYPLKFIELLAVYKVHFAVYCINMILKEFLTMLALIIFIIASFVVFISLNMMF